MPGSTDSGLGGEALKKHFLDHQLLWICSVLAIWQGLNIFVLATTQIMDAQKHGIKMPAWQALTLEASSVLTILALVLALVKIMGVRFDASSLKQKLLMHLGLSVAFSGLHILGMTAIRELVFRLMGASYSLGDWGQAFIYEYRKDLMTYITIVLVIYAYRLLIRRLLGEAKYVQLGESEQDQSPPDRLLVKKLGKEFLISVEDIDWVAASGNYANLHVHERVYPMRITMNRIVALLPANQFFRIHRSTIVNLHRVAHIEAQDSGDHLVTLTNGKKLGFSRRYRENFKEALAAQGRPK
ncbi:MAG: LytTR family DNA-binding domain-containing protein [Halioglobus sp.]